MKKILLLLPCVIFPYSLLFALYCIYTGFLMQSLFDNSVFILLIYIFALFFIALVCNIIFIVLCVTKKVKPSKISLINMVVKLIQIPAYLAIYIVGLIFLMTIFTFAFSIFFVLFDCLAIFLTGLIGASSLLRCFQDGKTSIKFSIIHSILQFVFCADIVSSIIVYIKSKSKSIKE